MSSSPVSNLPLIALVGTPNCGKSTLFNRITGLRQKVGNFPGVTVEPKTAVVSSEHSTVKLLDLPGLYSLDAKSSDESFSVDVLMGQSQYVARPDACLFIIDGTNLEKGLTLFAQFSRLQIPTTIVVTMIDAIKARGAVLDDIGLERAVGVPVFTVVGSKGIGVYEVLNHLLEDFTSFRIPKVVVAEDANIEQRVEWSRTLSHKVLTHQEQDKLTTRLDKVLLHPVAGGVVFLGVMALFFTAIFSWAEPLMKVIESGVGLLQTQVFAMTDPGLLQDFLSKGVLAGVGSVIVFLPQILLLMLFVTLLEDCGYLARAAFIVDRPLGLFGLQGRSFIPLLGSFACAIPGIMSARIIPSDKDRMATILIAPLMTCSARLPVYALLIAAFIPSTKIFGFASLQSVVLASLYALGLFAGLVISYIFRKTLFRSDKLHFLIEFPPYRMPSLKSVLVTLWSRCRDFITTAGTIILFISILLWAMSEFPKTTPKPGATALSTEQAQLSNSYAGQLGRAIQPIFAPLGFDWKITIGVIGSFAARETFVSVMGQMYATDVRESDNTLREVLHQSISLPAALSVLVFYVFALQCMSTIAIIKRETGSWKWSAFAFTYTFILAYSSSLVTFHLSSLLIQ